MESVDAFSSVVIQYPDDGSPDSTQYGFVSAEGERIFLSADLRHQPDGLRSAAVKAAIKYEDVYDTCLVVMREPGPAAGSVGVLRGGRGRLLRHPRRVALRRRDASHPAVADRAARRRVGRVELLRRSLALPGRQRRVRLLARHAGHPARVAAASRHARAASRAADPGLLRRQRRRRPARLLRRRGSPCDPCGSAFGPVGSSLT